MGMRGMTRKEKREYSKSVAREILSEAVCQVAMPKVVSIEEYDRAIQNYIRFLKTLEEIDERHKNDPEYQNCLQEWREAKKERETRLSTAVKKKMP